MLGEGDNCTRRLEGYVGSAPQWRKSGSLCSVSKESTAWKSRAVELYGDFSLPFEKLGDGPLPVLVKFRPEVVITG